MTSDYEVGTGPLLRCHIAASIENPVIVQYSILDIFGRNELLRSFISELNITEQCIAIQTRDESIISRNKTDIDLL
jgi:hypothetical protein